MSTTNIYTTKDQYEIENVQSVLTVGNFLEFVDDLGTSHYFNLQHLISYKTEEE